MSGAYAAGAHVLDEFRYFLCDDATISGTSQFEVLHQHYADASVPTKGMLIEDFIMMDNMYEDRRSTVQKCARINHQ
ncbi:hypothetical protein PC121_g20982 [Phytophthora cactorum]|nr:hypothetical protein PC121_g20982 [Phytophthora cactorum]